MKEQAKSAENKRAPAAQAFAGYHDVDEEREEPAWGFEDNRPVGAVHQKMQAMANAGAGGVRVAQMQAMANASVNGTGVTQLQALADARNHTGLPDTLKAGVENLSGLSMDDVRVHYNSDKPAQLQAHAYAQGSDIYVGGGQERHLPHEAWHVVQQKQGRVKATRQMHGAPVNEQPHLEREADEMGRRLVQMPSAVPVTGVLQNKSSATSVIQADTGILRPDDSDMEYVRMNVRGDGSCLFYSVFLSSVAHDMLDELRDEGLANIRPDEVEARVLQRAAHILGVERDALRDRLDQFQADERAAIADYWTDNLDDDEVSGVLKNDIKSIIISFLENLGLMGVDMGQAALVGVSDAKGGVVPKPSKPAEDDGELPDDEEGELSEGQDLSDDVQDANGQADDNDGEVLDDASGSENEEDSLSDDEDMQEVDEKFWLKRQKNKIGAFHQRAKQGFDKDDDGSHGGGPLPKHLTADELDDKEDPETMAEFLKSNIGFNIPLGSAFDIVLKNMIRTKWVGLDRIKFMPNDFDDELDGLVAVYVETFKNTKLFAGEAALKALMARHDFVVETHIYADANTRIQGDDDPVTVKVLETPNHFQVLVGPFAQGHLLHNKAMMPQKAEDTVEDKALTIPQAAMEYGVEVGANGFGITEVGIALGEGDTLRLWINTGDGHLDFVGWLNKRIAQGHLCSEELQRILDRFGGINGQTRSSVGDGFNYLGFLGQIRDRILSASKSKQPYSYELKFPLKEGSTIYWSGDIYAGNGTPLAYYINLAKKGPLNVGKSHKGIDLLLRVEGSIAMATNQLRNNLPADTVQMLLASVAGPLGALVELLRINSLYEASVLHPMPVLELPFRVFMPSRPSINKFMSRKRGNDRFDYSDRFDMEQYNAEVQRQATIQQKYLNQLSMDDWMLNRDLFNIRVAGRRDAILSNRSASYLSAIQDALLERNAEIGEKMGNRGNIKAKKERMGMANRQLGQKLMQQSGNNVLDFLMNRAKAIHVIRQRKPFDPSIQPEEQSIRKELLDLLAGLQELDVLDDNGEKTTKQLVSDLVGRSNSQGKWKKSNEKDLLQVVHEMQLKWNGLFPNRGNDDAMRGLAILHNPDQVAGGERDIPENAEDLSEFLGPGIVNSALGATWGLQEAGNEDERNTAQRLYEEIFANYPEECWPLFQMNVRLLLEIVEGSHVLPNKK